MKTEVLPVQPELEARGKLRGATAPELDLQMCAEPRDAAGTLPLGREVQRAPPPPALPCPLSLTPPTKG